MVCYGISKGPTLDLILPGEKAVRLTAPTIRDLDVTPALDM